jgi:hypothetical protein
MNTLTPETLVTIRTLEGCFDFEVEKINIGMREEPFKLKADEICQHAAKVSYHAHKLYHCKEKTPCEHQVCYGGRMIYCKRELTRSIKN